MAHRRTDRGLQPQSCGCSLRAPAIVHRVHARSQFDRARARAAQRFDQWLSGTWGVRTAERGCAVHRPRFADHVEPADTDAFRRAADTDLRGLAEPGVLPAWRMDAVAGRELRQGRDTLSDPGIYAGGGVFALLSRSEEHTSELQSLMRISYAVFCLTK